MNRGKGRRSGTKIAGVAAAGTVSAALGLVWNLTLPINKKMWTSSYVLFAGGLSLLLLAFVMLVVDMPGENAEKVLRSKQTRFYTPLLVFGTNAIAAYVVADLVEGSVYGIRLSSGVSLHHAIWDHLHALVPNAPATSLLYPCTVVAVCWLVMYALYRRRIFLKI